MDEKKIRELIDTAAKALCNRDEQRHRILENRTGEPCAYHERAAWDVVESLLPLIESSR